MAKLSEKGQMALGQLLNAEKEGTLSAVDKDILSDLKEVTGVYQDEIGPSDFVKAGLASVGETLSMPSRGIRGLAVGAVKGSPERAAEAVKPEYKPEPGEKAASIIGGITGDVASLGVGGTLFKAPKVAGPMYRLGRAAVEGATLGAAGSAAESGGDPTKTAIGGGLGAAGGLAGGTAAEGIGLVARTVGNVLKGKAAANVGEGALEKIGSSAALRGGTGSASSVSRAAKKLISKAEASRKSAGEAVGIIREGLGLPNRLETSIDEFLSTGGEQAQGLAKSVADRFNAAAKTQFESPTQALAYLDALKHDLDRLVSWNKVQTLSEGAAKAAPLDEAALIALRSRIDGMIGDLPIPGVKALRAAGESFSKKADAYAALFPRVKTEGGAEELLISLAKSRGDSAGRLSDTKAALKELGISRSAKSGAAKAASNLVKNAPVGGGLVQSLIDALGPAGRVNVFKSGKVLEEAGKALPGSKPLVAVGKSLTDVLKNRKGK